VTFCAPDSLTSIVEGDTKLLVTIWTVIFYQITLVMQRFFLLCGYADRLAALCAPDALAGVIIRSPDLMTATRTTKLDPGSLQLLPGLIFGRNRCPTKRWPCDLLTFCGTAKMSLFKKVSAF
jgi:hypothetical protein